MNYKEIAEMEKKNAGRVFLYIEGEKLVAYELSAFVVKQLFPHLHLFTVLEAEGTLMLFKIILPIDMVLENTEYPLAVSDYLAEMTTPNVSESERSAWKRDFEVYKINNIGVKNVLR